MAQGKARVHELARELGVTSRDLLAVLSQWGEFVKSASSVVEAPLALRVRAHYAAQPQRPITPRDYGVSADISQRTVGADGGFGAAVERARQQSRRSGRSSHTPGEIEIAIYRYVIDPRRTRRGGYTPEERDRAERALALWLATWLDDMAEWIRVSGGDRPDIAVKLTKAGLTPVDAELRLGFGRIAPDRDTIVARLQKGTIGFNDAVRQVDEFRRSQATGAS